MFENSLVTDVRGKSKFIVTTLLVGIISLTSLVVSLYSINTSLKNLETDLTIVTPSIAKIEDKPVVKTVKPQTIQKQEVSSQKIKTTNIPPIEQSTQIPVQISTVKPIESTTGVFTTEKPTEGTLEQGTKNIPIGNNTVGESEVVSTPVSTPEPTPRPTPVPTPRPSMVSGGVLNGTATSLPSPPYPTSARALRLSGKVVVSVVIDEEGNVANATVTSGHPLLASGIIPYVKKAKFTPTKLSGVAVKVSGQIVYNFNLN